MSTSSRATTRGADEVPAPAGPSLVPADRLDQLAERVRSVAGATAALIAVPVGDDAIVEGVDGPGAASCRGAGLGLDPATLPRSGASIAGLAALEPVLGGSAGHDGIAVPVGEGHEVEAVIVAVGLRDPDGGAELIRAVATGAETGLVAARAVAREALTRRTARSEHRRSHWARELHDQTLQELAAIRMSVERAVGGDVDDRTRTLLTEAIGQIDVATLELRRIVADLRPAKLDEGGLREALAALADRCMVLFDLDVDFDCSRCRRCGPGGDLDPDVEEAIYRVVQEALTNVIRHASAGVATVRVRHGADAHLVTVADDGVGFDPARVAEGFGMSGMRERAAIVRGDLQIESAPGAGTTVRLAVPIPSAQDDD